jgi:hypothetical protein
MENGGGGDYHGGDELKNMEDEEDRIDLDLKTQPRHGSGLEKDLEYSGAAENLPWMGPHHGSVYYATYIRNLGCNVVIFTYATCFVLGFMVISNMCAILLNE